MLKSRSMEIRSKLKVRDKAAYRKMSRGRRLELAIELSEFVLKLEKGVNAHNHKEIESQRLLFVRQIDINNVKL